MRADFKPQRFHSLTYRKDDRMDPINTCLKVQNVDASLVLLETSPVVQSLELYPSLTDSSPQTK